MDITHLGGNLRYYRQHLRLSQLALANRAGSAFCQSYVSRLECGLRPSDDQHVQTLAAALGVDRDALVRRPLVVRQVGRLRPVVLRASPTPARESDS